MYGNPRLKRVRGQRYPLTVNGAKSAWQRMRAKAGVTDFRFHDFRHDFGTKLLRDTGNLKLVQRALNHADIKSTLRYAHVLDEDVAAAVERVAKSRNKVPNQAARGELGRWHRHFSHPHPTFQKPSLPCFPAAGSRSWHEAVLQYLTS